MWRALEALVADLPVDLAQAFVLTQVVGLEYAEAAAVAGCPVGTIRSRVHRARLRLVAAVSDGSGEAEVLGAHG
jgi:RNA polymerase sigma-70 factor, ECF subfamily